MTNRIVVFTEGSTSAETAKCLNNYTNVSSNPVQQDLRGLRSAVYKWTGGDGIKQLVFQRCTSNMNKVL